MLCVCLCDDILGIYFRRIFFLLKTNFEIIISDENIVKVHEHWLSHLLVVVYYFNLKDLFAMKMSSEESEGEISNISEFCVLCNCYYGNLVS